MSSKNIYIPSKEEARSMIWPDFNPPSMEEMIEQCLLEDQIPGLRLGIGGREKGCIPWNKGLSNDKTKQNALNAAKTLKAQGHYENSGKYLPKLCGDDNYMKDPLIACKMILKRNGEEAAKRYLTKRKLPISMLQQIR
jgi:hypothetical protein